MSIFSPAQSGARSGYPCVHQISSWQLDLDLEGTLELSGLFFLLLCTVDYSPFLEAKNHYRRDFGHKQSCLPYFLSCYILQFQFLTIYSQPYVFYSVFWLIMWMSKPDISYNVAQDFCSLSWSYWSFSPDFLVHQKLPCPFQPHTQNFTSYL